MKIGIIILCRFESKRLPGKILMEIKGKPILEYIIDRLNKVSNIDNIVVATSDSIADKPIWDYCANVKFNLFKGDMDNVAKRFYDCAKKFDFDYAVRINGDNVLADPEIISSMISKIALNDYDFITNVHKRTFPIGMSVEIIKTDFYGKLLPVLKSPKYLEHVTLYLYEHPEKARIFYFLNHAHPKAKGLNLAIDTIKDINFVKKIIQKMELDHTNYNLRDICSIIKKI